MTSDNQHPEGNSGSTSQNNNFTESGQKEETAFSQQNAYEDENPGETIDSVDEAGPNEEEFGNDNGGGAGSSGSASTNSGSDHTL